MALVRWPCNGEPSVRNMWSFKTGGVSWQWSLKTGFTVLPAVKPVYKVHSHVRHHLSWTIHSDGRVYISLLVYVWTSFQRPPVLRNHIVTANVAVFARQNQARLQRKCSHEEHTLVFQLLCSNRLLADESVLSWSRWFLTISRWFHCIISSAPESWAKFLENT